MFRTIGLSLLVNGVCPYLLYSALEPHYPEGAFQPLLYATIFPLTGLVVGIVRKRMVDMIALIVLFSMAINIAAIFLTPSLKWALVARSLNGLFTATAMLVSALIGKPIFYYVARQFVTRRRAGPAGRVRRRERSRWSQDLLHRHAGMGARCLPALRRERGTGAHHPAGELPARESGHQHRAQRFAERMDHPVHARAIDPNCHQMTVVRPAARQIPKAATGIRIRAISSRRRREQRRGRSPSPSALPPPASR